MKYSILVATMNRPQAVAKLLETVEKQTFLPQECILVDQSRDDVTLEVCEAYQARIKERGQVFKYVRQETPSLVKARNRGIDESTGEIICFVDDDLILNEDYFQRIDQYFKDPSVGGVTGNVILPGQLKGIKWELRKLLMRVFLLNSFNGKLTLSTFGYPIYEREVDRVLQVELFGGYSMNFRRELLLANRPDEWFSGYGYREDVDLSYRISRSAKLIIVPDARFIHDVSTVSRLEDVALKRMKIRNYQYLCKKFKKYGLATWILFIYSLCGITLMDFLEFLSSLDKNKWEIFTSNYKAILNLRTTKVDRTEQ